jgi:hypothetical protein
MVVFNSQASFSRNFIHHLKWFNDEITTLGRSSGVATCTYSCHGMSLGSIGLLYKRLGG